MSYYPLSQTPVQYHVNGSPASGYVMKAYQAGTSTLLQMATDSTGGTLVNTITLNSEGYPAVSGNIVIPHINAAYKIALYASQAAADANSGAIWNPDNLTTQAITGNISSPSTQNADYTFVLADAGKTIVKTAADTTTRTWTIPLEASVAFSNGTIIQLINLDDNSLTIVASGAATLKWLNASAPADGNRTLAQGGVATIYKDSTDSWLIWGNAALT